MNLKLKINSRGEIATVLTLVSVGLMLMGVAVGNVAVQTKTQLKSLAANSDKCPTSCPAGNWSCVEQPYAESSCCADEAKKGPYIKRYTNPEEAWKWDAGAGTCGGAQGIEKSAPPPAQPPSGNNKCSVAETCSSFSGNSVWITLRNDEIEISRPIFYDPNKPSCQYASRDTDNNCVGDCVNDTRVTEGVLNNYCRKGSIPAAKDRPCEKPPYNGRCIDVKGPCKDSEDTGKGPATCNDEGLRCCVPKSDPANIKTACEANLNGECRATNNCEPGFTRGNEGENGCKLSEFCCAVNDPNYPKPVTASSICPSDYCKTATSGCNSEEDKIALRCEDSKICCLPKGKSDTCHNLNCADYLTASGKANNTSGGKLVSYDSATKLWYQDAGCNEKSGAFTENSAGMNSYCSLPEACTSCVFGKCAYHLERDPRSGRAEPGILPCTDTGCINDTECEFDRKCAINGEDCTSKSCCTGTNISGNQVDLTCNAQKKCEPKVNPDDIPACDDFTDKKECEKECGTRGCEGVTFAGGYVPGKNAAIVNGTLVPNCWRCNTKNYCSFGDESCTAGAGKPTPILMPKSGDLTGKTATCPLPGLNLTNDCVNCILKDAGWIIDPNGKDNIAKNLIAKNKWKAELQGAKCKIQDMARYWCSGGDGNGNTANQDSINQCKNRYLDSSSSEYRKPVGFPDGCADLCKITPKTGSATNISQTGKTTCGLPIGNYNSGKDLPAECSKCIAEKNIEWIKKDSTLQNPIRKVDNIPDNCTNQEVAQYWCTGRIPGEQSTKSMDDCWNDFIKGACSESKYKCNNVVRDPSNDSSTTTGNGCSITAPVSWKKDDKFDVSATVTDAANRDATATKIILMKGGLRSKTVDAGKAGTGWKATDITLGETGTYKVLFNFTKPRSTSTVECDPGAKITITDSSGADTNVCNLKVTSDKLPEACSTCILNDATTKAKIDSDYPSATYPKCTPDTLVNYWCGKNNPLCRNAMNSNACKKRDICLNASDIQLPMPVLAYSNEDFQTFIDGVKTGKYNALDASLYVTNASRVPGLQRQYCDPFKGQCDFYYQQPQTKQQQG